MAVVVEQDGGVFTSNGLTSVNDSFASTPTAGNHTMSAFSVYEGAGTPTLSVSDNQANSYSEAYTTGVVRNTMTSLHYAENITSSGTFTITNTFDSGSYGCGVIFEVSGLETSSSLRYGETDTATNTATDANITSAATSAVADDLIVATACAVIVGDSDVGWGANATTGYTNIAQYADYQNIGSISVDYKVATSGGSQSANWSHDAATGADNGWCCGIACFKVAGGGSGPTIAPIATHHIKQMAGN